MYKQRRMHNRIECWYLYGNSILIPDHTDFGGNLAVVYQPSFFGKHMMITCMLHRWQLAWGIWQKLMQAMQTALVICLINICNMSGTSATPCFCIWCECKILAYTVQDSRIQVLCRPDWGSHSSSRCKFWTCAKTGAHGHRLLVVDSTISPTSLTATFRAEW